MQKTVSLKELPGTFISSGMTLSELCEYLNVSIELINEWERFFNLFPETSEQKEKIYSKRRIKDFIKIKDSYEKGTPLHEIRRRLFKASTEEANVIAAEAVVALPEKAAELPVIITASTIVKPQPEITPVATKAPEAATSILTKVEPIKKEETKTEPTTSALPKTEPVKKEATPAVATSNILLVSKPEKQELPVPTAETKPMSNPFEKKSNAAQVKAIVEEIVENSVQEAEAAAANPFLTQLTKANEKIGELILEKAKIVEETAIEKANLMSEIKILNSKNIELLSEKETLFGTVKEKEQEIKRSQKQESLLAESLKISQVMLSQKEEEIAYIKGRIETFEQQLQEKDNIIQTKSIEIDKLLEKQNKKWWHALRDIFF